MKRTLARVTDRNFDVVVAGGSFGGSAAAMAFARLGARVLLCEPGLASEKRLAGELLQAPAVELLERLGFLDAIWAAGAIPSCGFSIFTRHESRPVVLSYAEVEGLHPSGLAIEHATLAQVMLDTVSAHPNVTTVAARVTPPPSWRVANLELAIEDRSARLLVTTPLVIAADGRGSKLRESAGIKTTRGAAQRMLGVRVTGEHLPTEGYGHVFLGGQSPVLAYRISPREIRLMFEVAECAPNKPHESDLAALPDRLAAAVERECAAKRALSAVIFPVTAQTRTAPHLALVGDAGGAAHPITASGVAFCLSDANALAEAYRDAAGDLDDAFETFEAARKKPALTRHLLAPALRSALGDDTEAMRALREGLIHYWQTDRRGRAASMGLLSTRDPRPSAVVTEYGRVVGLALRRLRDRERSLVRFSRIGYALGKESWSLAAATIKSSLVRD